VIHRRGGGREEEENLVGVDAVFKERSIELPSISHRNLSRDGAVHLCQAILSFENVGYGFQSDPCPLLKSLIDLRIYIVAMGPKLSKDQSERTGEEL
jgi:hypothetical protein